MATVKPVSDTPSNVGTGLLDVARAMSQQVRADVGSLSFGLLEFPHTKTFTKTITYSNASAAPVTLALRHDLGANFTVPASVTVPAGGTAALDVVLDPRKGNGTFFGHVTATASGISLVTSVGAYVQEERHTLTLSMIGRDGKPLASQPVLLVNMSTQDVTELRVVGGVGSARLPVADYAVLGRISERTTNYHWYTPVSVTEVAGRVSLATDVTMTVDARQGKAISVKLPDADSVVWNRHAELRVPYKPGKFSGVSGAVDGRTPVYGVSFGPPLPDLTYDSGLKGGQPLISVVGGFPVNYYENSKFLEPGDHPLDVAERGADVRGKLALVRTAGDSPAEVARAMREAGAVAVLWAGPVPMWESEPTAIPVILVGEHHVTATPSRVTLRAISGSPVSYTLYLQDKGSLPAGKARHVKRSELAEVRARYYSSGADGYVRQRNYPVVNGVFREAGAVLDEPLTAPMERTEYYTAGNGIGWYQEGIDGRSVVTTWADLEPVTFTPGKKYERSNLKAVASPRFGRSSVVSWGQGGGVERGRRHDQLSDLAVRRFEVGRELRLHR